MFDRIVLTLGVSRRVLTQEEFFELPLTERLQSVLERRVTFYLGQQEVDAKEALSALRKLRTRP